MKYRSKGARGGFSLAELLVVVVIIGILASLVAVNVVGSAERARRAAAEAEIGTIYTALGSYAAENGRYPDDLAALVTPDETGHTFLDSRTPPEDPWGNSYDYAPPVPGETRPTLRSFAADGQPEGEGTGLDVRLEDLLDD